MIHFQLAFNQFLSMHFQQDIYLACKEIEASECENDKIVTKQRGDSCRLARKSRLSPPRRLDFDVGSAPSSKIRNASSVTSTRVVVETALRAEVEAKRSEAKWGEEENEWVVVDSGDDWVHVEASPSACK